MPKSLRLGRVWRPAEAGLERSFTIGEVFIIIINHIFLKSDLNPIKPLLVIPPKNITHLPMRLAIIHPWDIPIIASKSR